MYDKRVFRGSTTAAMVVADLEWRREKQVSSLGRRSPDQVLGCSFKNIEPYLPEIFTGSVVQPHARTHGTRLVTSHGIART